MKKYLKYKIAKSLPLFIFLTAFALIFYVVPLLQTDFTDWNKGPRIETNGLDGTTYAYTPSLDLCETDIIVFLAGACLITAMWATSYKMSKRSCDLFYSLPLPKRKLFAVNFFVGFGVIIAAYTIAFIFGFAIVLAKVQRISVVHYLWFYFALIIPAFTIYSIATFFYTQGNNASDGMLFVILSLYAGALAVFAFCEAFSINSEWSNAFTIFAPLNFVKEGFSAAIRNGELSSDYTAKTWLGVSVVTASSAAATAWLFRKESKNRAENCEQISDSVFGYRLLLPIYAISIYSLCLTDIDDLALVAIIFAISYAAESLHKRTLKIGWKSFVLLVGYFVCGLLVKTLGTYI